MMRSMRSKELRRGQFFVCCFYIFKIHFQQSYITIKQSFSQVFVFLRETLSLVSNSAATHLTLFDSIADSSAAKVAITAHCLSISVEVLAQKERSNTFQQCTCHTKFCTLWISLSSDTLLFEVSFP